MVSVGVIVAVILLVAIRLLGSPFPVFQRLSRRFGTRTTVVLCSIAVAGAVVAIAISRH